VSIQSDAKIRELERRVAALEEALYSLTREKQEAKPHTLTLPEKRKSA
jgi:hypothetical protein